MATKKIPFEYFLYQDRSSNPRKSGKFYGKRFNSTVLGTRGLAQHMINHGLIAERSEVEDVLNGLTTCIPELLKQGMSVKLDGLGSFRATVSVHGAERIAAYSVQKHMRGIHMRFIPDQTNIDNISSKKFKQECSLVCVGYETVDAQTGVHTLRPVSAYVAPTQP